MMLHLRIRGSSLPKYYIHEIIKIRLKTKQTKVLALHRCCCFGRSIPTQKQVTLRDHMTFRKWQAHRSVLIEAPQAKYDCVHSLCKTFGQIKYIFPYVNTGGKSFCLVEFSNSDGVKSLLKTCNYSGSNTEIPVSSNILYYKPETDSLCFSNVCFQKSCNDNCTNVDRRSSQTSASMQMIKFHEPERISEVDMRLRFLFCSALENILCGVLPFCKVLPYESTINGLGYHSSCLNILVNTYPKINDMTSVLEFSTKNVLGFDDCQDLHVLNTIGDIISTFAPGVSYVKKKLRSQVPLIAFHNNILGINCDVALNDMSLIYLSELIFLCGELDSCVRPFILALKHWASEIQNNKYCMESGINDLSFTLIAIFFLQTRSCPVLPSFNQMELTGIKKNPISKKFEIIETLLKEFFTFLGNFPFKHRSICVYYGKSDVKPNFSPLYVRNPVNRQINICENVTQEQLDHLCEAACCALWNFEALSGSDNHRTRNCTKSHQSDI